MLKFESLDSTAIESSLMDKYSISPEKLIQRLWSALNLTCNFPIGEYLLSHQPSSSGPSKIMIHQVDDR